MLQMCNARGYTLKRANSDSPPWSPLGLLLAPTNKEEPAYKTLNGAGSYAVIPNSTTSL